MGLKTRHRGKFVCLLLRDRFILLLLPCSSPMFAFLQFPHQVLWSAIHYRSGIVDSSTKSGREGIIKMKKTGFYSSKKKMIQLICRRFLGLILREAKRITLLWWCWCRVLVDLLSFYSSNSYKSIKCLVSPLFFKYCSNNMSSNKLLMVERLFFLRTLMICLGGTCEMWYVFRFSFVLKLTELLLFRVCKYNTSSMVKIIQ